MRRRVRIGLFVAGVVAAVLALAAVFLSQTDPGREIVRRQIVGILSNNSHGIVRIQGLSGNTSMDRISITSMGAAMAEACPRLPDSHCCNC